MAFSEEWDERYRENTHMSIWPFSDLVGYVMRYARPDHKGYRVLELGCGAGANIPFFKHLGVDYYAIEGSSTIVKSLTERFPELIDKIVVGDFTNDIPFGGDFDLVVDRASLTHNSTAAIKRCLELVFNSLKPGCKFVGIDWFSTVHTDYVKGEFSEDKFTRCNYIDGPFAKVGQVHFSNQEHLLELFEEFNLEVLEEKIIDRKIPDKYLLATWNLVARK